MLTANLQFGPKDFRVPVYGCWRRSTSALASTYIIEAMQSASLLIRAIAILPKIFGEMMLFKLEMSFEVAIH